MSIPGANTLSTDLAALFPFLWVNDWGTCNIAAVASIAVNTAILCLQWWSAEIQKGALGTLQYPREQVGASNQNSAVHGAKSVCSSLCHSVTVLASSPGPFFHCKPHSSGSMLKEDRKIMHLHLHNSQAKKLRSLPCHSYQCLTSTVSNFTTATAKHMCPWSLTSKLVVQPLERLCPSPLPSTSSYITWTSAQYCL